MKLFCIDELYTNIIQFAFHRNFQRRFKGFSKRRKFTILSRVIIIYEYYTICLPWKFSKEIFSKRRKFTILSRVIIESYAHLLTGESVTFNRGHCGLIARGCGYYFLSPSPSKVAFLRLLPFYLPNKRSKRIQA